MNSRIRWARLTRSAHIPHVHRRMRYREYAPRPPLVPYVACFWAITVDCDAAGPARNRVLPDGCVDILAYPGDESPWDGCSRLIGAMRRPAVFDMPPGAQVIGVRFRPGGARPFLDLSLAELTDRAVPLAEIIPHFGDELDHRMAAISTAPEAVAALETMLLGRVARWLESDPIVRRSLALLHETGGGIGITSLARAVGLSSRQLERRFAAATGLGPKVFAGVIRFRRVLKLFERPAFAGWSGLAAEAGFYDQAHFIREFRRLAGVTPRAFLRERAGVGIVQYGTPADL